MKQQRFAQAEQVYRDDLARLPDNGWSLLGLAESLRKQNKNPEEAAQTQAKFQRIWAKADLTITSSCLCQPRT
jgi:cytochrome c-type biogenesis protein CcmH/NrfG